MGRGADCGESGRREQSDRAEELPERAAAGFFDSARRAFRDSRDGRRQPHDRQSEDRHQPRRDGHRLLPKRARLELQREFAWDDGICLKSSFALGYARATEMVTITQLPAVGQLRRRGAAGRDVQDDFRPMRRCRARGGSSSGRSRMVDSRTSRFRIACSTAAADWRSRAWMER